MWWKGKSCPGRKTRKGKREFEQESTGECPEGKEGALGWVGGRALFLGKNRNNGVNVSAYIQHPS